MNIVAKIIADKRFGLARKIHASENLSLEEKNVLKEFYGFEEGDFEIKEGNGFGLRSQQTEEFKQVENTQPAPIMADLESDVTDISGKKLKVVDIYKNMAIFKAEDGFYGYAPKGEKPQSAYFVHKDIQSVKKEIDEAPAFSQVQAAVKPSDAFMTQVIGVLTQYDQNELIEMLLEKYTDADYKYWAKNFLDDIYSNFQGKWKEDDFGTKLEEACKLLGKNAKTEKDKVEKAYLKKLNESPIEMKDIEGEEHIESVRAQTKPLEIKQQLRSMLGDMHNLYPELKDLGLEKHLMDKFNVATNNIEDIAREIDPKAEAAVVEADSIPKALKEFTQDFLHEWDQENIVRLLAKYLPEQEWKKFAKYALDYLKDAGGYGERWFNDLLKAACKVLERDWKAEKVKFEKYKGWEEL